jgi:hypothetical protein
MTLSVCASSVMSQKSWLAKYFSAGYKANIHC